MRKLWIVLQSRIMRSLAMRPHRSRRCVSAVRKGLFQVERAPEGNGPRADRLALPPHPARHPYGTGPRALDWGMLGNDMSTKVAAADRKAHSGRGAPPGRRDDRGGRNASFCAPGAGYKFSRRLLHRTERHDVSRTEFTWANVAASAMRRHARSGARSPASNPCSGAIRIVGTRSSMAQPERSLSRSFAKFEPRAIFVPVFLKQPLEHRRIQRSPGGSPRDRDRCRPRSKCGAIRSPTRAPGNVVVDVTRGPRKNTRSRLWITQNYFMDYAHLAHGRDIASSYFLKSQRAGGRRPCRDVSGVRRTDLWLYVSDSSSISPLAPRHPGHARAVKLPAAELLHHRHAEERNLLAHRAARPAPANPLLPSVPAIRTAAGKPICSITPGAARNGLPAAFPARCAAGSTARSRISSPRASARKRRKSAPR